MNALSDEIETGGSNQSSSKVTLERLFVRRVLQIMTNADKGDEDAYSQGITAALEFMKRDSKGNLLRPGVVSARFRYFVKSGICSGNMLLRFKEEYIMGRHNPGNTTAHHAPTNFEILITNEVLDYYAQTGQYFYVQGKVEDGSNRSGENFDEPAYGTPMEVTVNDYSAKLRQSVERTVTSFQVKNGQEKRILYLQDPPARLMPYLVYNSVRGRFKQDTRQHNTNATKASNYRNTHEFKVPMYMNGQSKLTQMINTNNGKSYKIPKHNVVLMWFEPIEE